MLVYYLEEPYGHLMGEKMGGAQARTHVRGNVFSLNMPWRDIMESCEEATKNGGAVGSSHLRDAEREVGVPHSETTLAQLVHIHIRGGTKDLADHLKGFKIMRASGYPGYSERGINSSAQVARRLKQQHTDIYGFASFIPAAIQQGINVKND